MFSSKTVKSSKQKTAPKNNKLDSLTSQELKELISNDKNMQNEVHTYVYNNLEIYYNSDRHFLNQSKIPTLESTKRALALAVTFSPEAIPFILKLHPEIISEVLETRSITVNNPLTNESFTALWHFKLSHLLAYENSLFGHSCLFRFMADKNDNECNQKKAKCKSREEEKSLENIYKSKHHADLSLFFSEPICWESGSKKGKKGPTGPFIAILQGHGKFFIDIASTDCLLTPDEGYDEPYNSINPCYIALQQAANKSNHINTLIHQYAYTASSKMIQECVDILIAQALNGNYQLLKLFLDAPSQHVWSFLNSPMFKAIEANDLNLISLLSQKIDNVNHIRDKDQNSPLFIATQKALVDEKYLPLVKHFLLCGYPTKSFNSSPADLVKEEGNPLEKQLRHYFEIAEKFDKVIMLCAKKNPPLKLFHLYSQVEKNPTELLIEAAKLDTAFFNELAVSFLENGDAWMLNKKLNYFEDLKYYFTCLFSFTENREAPSYLTAATLEKIGDALLDYRKLRAYICTEEDNEAFNYANYYYKLAYLHNDISDESKERVMNKLTNIDQHEKPDIVNHTQKLSFK